MSQVLLTTILEVCDGDEDFYRELCLHGVLPEQVDELVPDHLEVARVAHLLLRELEVNWPGVELVLRMRRELIESRRQVADLLELLRSHHAPR